MDNLTKEEYEELNNIIELMTEEGEGSRGVFYENYGSSIRNTLKPLAEILQESSNKKKALEFARMFHRGY